MALRSDCTIFRASTKFSVNVPCLDGRGKPCAALTCDKIATSLQKGALAPTMAKSPRQSPTPRELLRKPSYTARRPRARLSHPALTATAYAQTRHRPSIVRDKVVHRKRPALTRYSFATQLAKYRAYTRMRPDLTTEAHGKLELGGYFFLFFFLRAWRRRSRVCLVFSRARCPTWLTLAAAACCSRTLRRPAAISSW